MVKSKYKKDGLYRILDIPEIRGILSMEYDRHGVDVCGFDRECYSECTRCFVNDVLLSLRGRILVVPVNSPYLDCVVSGGACSKYHKYYRRMVSGFDSDGGGGAGEACNPFQR